MLVDTRREVAFWRHAASPNRRARNIEKYVFRLYGYSRQSFGLTFINKGKPIIQKSVVINILTANQRNAFVNIGAFTTSRREATTNF